MNEKPIPKVSRSEVLPAFIGVLVCTIVLFVGMSALQPLLMDNAYIHDFGTMLEGAMAGSLYYRVMWFLADWTEATFLASVPASIFMIIGGFIAAYLERKKSRFAGTGVDGHGKYFSSMFFATAAAILLGMIVFAGWFPGWTGWVPTFAVVLTVQVFVVFYGTSPAKLITVVLAGTAATYPVVYLIMTYIVSPLGLPLFVSVSIAVMIVVIVLSMIFNQLSWMKIEEKPKEPEAEPAAGEKKPSPTSFFVNRVFGDVGELAIWGSSIATITMYVGAMIGWFLNPLEPGYGAGNLPLLIASQLAVAALAVFVYYPKWKNEGWAFTFPGIVLVSAIVGFYAATGTPADIVIAVTTVLIGGFLFSPLVEWVMKICKYKGKYHVIALIQLSIWTVCSAWSFVVMYVIIPLFA